MDDPQYLFNLVCQLYDLIPTNDAPQQFNDGDLFFVQHPTSPITTNVFVNKKEVITFHHKSFTFNLADPQDQQRFQEHVNKLKNLKLLHAHLDRLENDNSGYIDYDHKILTCPVCGCIDWHVYEGYEGGQESCKQCSFYGCFINYKHEGLPYVEGETFVNTWQGNHTYDKDY